MEINRQGCTRIVVLTKRWAIKIPNFLNGWKLFLRGLLANDQEFRFSKTGWPELCPVRFSLPVGLCVVMPRAEPMPEERWDEFDYESFCEREHYRVPVESKANSFGFLNGKPVAIDYGN